jgi:hypothetical protein
MTTPAPPRSKWLDFLPVISLAIVMAGILLASGGYIGQLKENTRRIEQLETEARADAKARTEMLQQLDLRLARIEVKLEMMVPEKDKAP